MSTTEQKVALQKAPLTVHSDLEPQAVRDIAGGLNARLADVFALYLKTKNFHWHMSGPHFRDYHLLLDDHGDQLFRMTDDIAERVRKTLAGSGADDRRCTGQRGAIADHAEGAGGSLARQAAVVDHRRRYSLHHRRGARAQRSGPEAQRQRAV